MTEREWLPVSTAARRMGISARKLQEMCQHNEIRRRTKNPFARRKTYEVHSAAVADYVRAQGGA